nr:copia protein [Tanacetum cinerariifolium]
KLGNLSITDYFSKINRLVDLLANIDAPVDDKNLVYYAIQSMLLLKESRLARKSNRLSALDSTSSSPHVLLAAALNNRNNFTVTTLLQAFNAMTVQDYGDSSWYMDTGATSHLASNVVLSLIGSRQWSIHQLDVKNAFLHGHLSETVYMHQPPGFVDPAHPHHVCLLQKSLYGLKQAPRAWFQRFASYATHVGFQHSRTDSFVFIFQQENDIAYLLIYVDDIILTASSSDLLKQIISSLHVKLSMTDLGPLNYFLRISAQRISFGLFLSQTKYACEVFERADMMNCNPGKTPADTESRLGPDGDPVSDPSLHRSLAGCPTTRRSTSEYRGVANAVAKTTWVRNLLRELLVPLRTSILVYCDNADVKVGGWGGDGGRGEWEWPFAAGSNLSKIQVISNAECVVSVMFTTYSPQGGQHNSKKFGGAGVKGPGILTHNADVKVGGWGGDGGRGEWEWPFAAGSNLSKIQVISNAECIVSVMFTTYSPQGGQHNSKKFGGAGVKGPGILTHNIQLGFGELVSEIRGTYAVYQTVTVITSLTFVVGTQENGPYGKVNGTAFSLPVINGKITGFWGNSDKYLDSLGVFLANP